MFNAKKILYILLIILLLHFIGLFFLVEFSALVQEVYNAVFNKNYIKYWLFIKYNVNISEIQ